MHCGQSEIGDDTEPVLSNQNVFRFEIAMGDGRFAFGAENFRVQMNQAAGNRKANGDHIVMC